MKFDPSGMYLELKRLRQREGVRASSVRARIGPQLERLCGITDLDTEASVRGKLTRKIDYLIRDYASERQLILRVTLGMHDDAPHAALDRRLEWLAPKLSLTKRTLQRRVEGELKLLVTDAVADARESMAAADLGYAIEELDTKIKFVGDRPTVVRRLRIRAVDECLETIHCGFGVPQPPPGQAKEPEFDIVVRGAAVRAGRIHDSRRERRPAGDVIVYNIEPDPPIEKGERCEFEVEIKFPPGQPMEPHYVLQRKTVVEFLRVKVEFDPSHPPVHVWRVNRAQHREIDGYTPERQVVHLDSSCAVEGLFHDLSDGSYGFAWEWGLGS